MPWGFRRFGHFSFFNLFLKKVTPAGLNSLRQKGYHILVKNGNLMIQSTKRGRYWSFGCQVWSNHQNKWILWWNEAVEVIEAIEVVEAIEVIEAADVLRTGKSLLRTSKLSRSLNPALFWCFEKEKFWVESWNIILNFSTFSVGDCWSQLMLLFWKQLEKTQMSKPPQATRHPNVEKILILLSLRAI